MKVCGFSFIRNAGTYDYPIVEAVRSILPVCDEVVVAVGASEDGTEDLVRSIDPRVRVLRTTWDDTLREGGRVLAEETNKALDAVPGDADWALYIQGDEVLHEDGLDAVRTAMEDHAKDERVDGLLFSYLHFYGSYDLIGDPSAWYPFEVRAVRPGQDVRSWKDAQGFRRADGRKLRVVEVDATIHHYGWVKDPRTMQRKQEDFNRLWHEDAEVERRVPAGDEWDYGRERRVLHPFAGTHPAVMKERLARADWHFPYEPGSVKPRWKERLKNWSKRRLGLELEYQNYELVNLR